MIRLRRNDNYLMIATIIWWLVVSCKFNHFVDAWILSNKIISSRKIHYEKWDTFDTIQKNKIKYDDLLCRFVSHAPSIFDFDIMADDDKPPQSPMSYSMEKLSENLKGIGRARACWECFRIGLDPMWLYEPSRSDTDLEPFPEEFQHMFQPWTREKVGNAISTFRKGQGLGGSAQHMYKRVAFPNFVSIEQSIASLDHITTCTDGTKKLLLKLHHDGLQVETVIIPFTTTKGRIRSTLCISSQIGCKQGCTFCLTGKMGKARSLTADEILAQVYWANKIVRLSQGALPAIENIVYMGMGEPADNVANVVTSANRLTHRLQFDFAPKRVTISTIAPTPSAFSDLIASTDVAIAWSVHATRDELRKQLVPTTKHSMVELRAALINALNARPSNQQRSCMLEITLLDEINNDPNTHAMDLVEFCQPLLNQVQNLKLIVNLIPWNDIGATFGSAATYKTPSMSNVMAFQAVLKQNGIFCYIRTTRGDDESAACGQLSTSSSNKKQTKNNNNEKTDKNDFSIENGT